MELRSTNTAIANVGFTIAGVFNRWTVRILFEIFGSNKYKVFSYCWYYDQKWKMAQKNI